MHSASGARHWQEGAPDGVSATLGSVGLAAVVAADWAKSSAELGPVACARARAVLAALLPAELRNIWL